MDVLPDRLYANDVNERRRQLPYGRRHPAKMNLALLGDLIRRYTLPGQTWLDPFFGIGSTGTAVLTGRSVIGIELEAHHAEDARKNIAHLARYARDGATATVLQGDSRRLRELLTTAAAGTLASPPYGDTALLAWASGQRGSDGNLTSAATKGQVGYGAAGTLASPPYADADVAATHNPSGGFAKAFHERGEGVRAFYRSVGYGEVAGSVMSPPYADIASRDRSEEPYASKDPERAAKYGQDNSSRNVDGYGKSGAQIGNLALGDVPEPRGTNQHTLHDGTENLGNQRGETYLNAVAQVYAAVYAVTPEGGVLVLVVGSYVRSGAVVDIAAHTIAVCCAVGWTPVERWHAKKQNVSFWRRLHARKGLPLIDYEDVLVFCRGKAPGWPFAELPAQPLYASQPTLELSA